MQISAPDSRPFAARSLPPSVRTRGVSAILGPTNTGKTHYALERMIAHPTGMIGLPLRLLAREVYGRLVEKVGVKAVALVTGEEKIKPERPRFWVSTVEAMPRDIVVDFVAIDEIQLAADMDRGHVFTDRLLNQRGRAETLLIGSGTIRPLIERLLPGVPIITRPRLSTLVFAGEKKITRLPARSAIVAFSAEEVYAVAELIRRQKGGAAVVMGSLSPRTRNAQVELYQSGEVDYLVATDAIGMGLNLDVDHVAFASDRKFDGHRFRRLTPAEFGQIAGRAGRNMRDGTFGSSGRCPPFEPELVESIEGHRFDPLSQIYWRNPDLDFRSLAGLKRSLAVQPSEAGLARAADADDVVALEIVAADADIRDLAGARGGVERLWETCQVPDYRKVSPQLHAELVATLYRHVMTPGRIPADWFRRQVEPLDRTDGDIDTLSNRLAQIRTWTFVANRPDWLADPEHWQGVTRQVEDRLSDALHERLASRFVDRRTSVLMRRLRENAMLEAEVTATGDVLVEGQHVGSLSGFRFVPDATAVGQEARALTAAALKALTGELESRAAKLSLAADDAFILANDGLIRWTGEPVARLDAGEKLLTPRLRLISDEHLTGPAREQVENRLNLWLKAHVTRLLGPLLVLEDAPDLTGMARGIAFQIAEALGVLARARVADEVKGLDQEARAALRKHGVRFGAYHLYLPALLKPAPRALAAQLWALKHGGLEQKGRDDLAHLALSGRTSIPADKEVSRDLYRAAGFQVAGERALRVDILERLADLIRPAIAYRPGVTAGEPPAGTADGDGFVVTPAMTSLIGAAGTDFAGVLKALGYQMQTRPGPAITVPLLVPAPTVPVTVIEEPVDASAGPVAGDAHVPAAEAEATVAAEVDSPVAAQPVAEAATTEGATEQAESAAVAETMTDSEAAPVADVAVAAVETIEVWRPARRHEHRGDARGRQRAERGGERSSERGGEGRRRFGPRPDQAAASSGEGAPRREGERRSGDRPQGERGAGERREGRREDGRRDERRDGPRAERPRRDEGRRDETRREGRDENRGSRPDRGRDGGRRDQERRAPMVISTETKPRGERQPDPNSPFAKLAALKAQMDAGRK